MRRNESAVKILVCAGIGASFYKVRKRLRCENCYQNPRCCRLTRLPGLDTSVRMKSLDMYQQTDFTHWLVNVNETDVLCVSNGSAQIGSLL